MQRGGSVCLGGDGAAGGVAAVADLRGLSLAVGVRTGRQTIYGLYDSHVAVLLDEALRRIEHLRAGAGEIPRSGRGTNSRTMTGSP